MTTRNSAADTSVAAYIAALAEPLRTEVALLRRVVLDASDGIQEDVKWNAPSFHTGEHFATMRLNGKVLLQLILHLGAKPGAISRSAIADPQRLLQWLGPDRACVSFEAPGAVSARADALQALLRQWVQQVPARPAA